MSWSLMEMALCLFLFALWQHFFDPELRDLMIFATDEADSQNLLERFIDKDVLPHCIHPGGKDGRVARGYEHVIMEGGLLPEEGTYTTPDHCKNGKTRAEHEEALLEEDTLDETLVTSNLRRQQEQKQQPERRSQVMARPLVPPTHCQVLGKGSFELVMLAQQCRAEIALDIERYHLVI